MKPRNSCRCTEPIEEIKFVMRGPYADGTYSYVCTACWGHRAVVNARSTRRFEDSRSIVKDTAAIVREGAA